MQYLVEMKLADSARPDLHATPPEAIAFIEQSIIRSLEMLEKLQGEKKVLAGGPLGGAIAVTVVVEVDSIHELDQMLESLPFWPRMVVTVTPITTFANRISALSQFVERIKAQIQGATAG